MKNVHVWVLFNGAKHDLVEPYPVYQEKEGEFVAEFKITDSDIKQLLTSSTQKKKKNKKKKKVNANQGVNAATSENIEAIEDDGDQDFEDEPDEIIKKKSSGTTSKKAKSKQNK